MRIHIVARKMKMTDAIKTFIEERLAKLQDYVSDIVWAQVIVSVEKKLHNADIVLHVGNQTMK
ncbi:MAG: HPF/RaiA family ribosome-associated protein, partial [Elusimicrobiales bacterium]|nr:HPF/RaiA family ribosome-associated protein [Elusimicrobiales bacterium]